MPSYPSESNPLATDTPQGVEPPMAEIDDRQGTLMGFELPEGPATAVSAETNEAVADPAAAPAHVPRAEPGPVFGSSPPAASHPSGVSRVAVSAKVRTNPQEPASTLQKPTPEPRRLASTQSPAAQSGAGGAAATTRWSTLHASSPFAPPPAATPSGAVASGASGHDVRSNELHPLALNDHLQRLKWLLAAVVIVALLIVLTLGVTQTRQLARLTREANAQQAHLLQLTQQLQDQQATLDGFGTTLSGMSALLKPVVRSAHAVRGASMAAMRSPNAGVAKPASPHPAKAAAPAHTRKTKGTDMPKGTGTR